MGNSYRVTTDTEACTTCGQGHTWGIVLPGDDNDPTLLGTFFYDEAEAEEWCGVLNQAYQLGMAAERKEAAMLRPCDTCGEPNPCRCIEALPGEPDAMEVGKRYNGEEAVNAEV